MKSLLLLSSKRIGSKNDDSKMTKAPGSKHDDETAEVTSNDSSKESVTMNDSIEEEDDDFHLVKKMSNPNQIKYIDDYDTDSIKSLINLINKTNTIRIEPVNNKVESVQLSADSSQAMRVNASGKLKPLFLPLI